MRSCPFIMDPDEGDVIRIIQRIKHLHCRRSDQTEYMACAFCPQGFDSGLPARHPAPAKLFGPAGLSGPARRFSL
jgi:hypothetical protein